MKNLDDFDSLSSHTEQKQQQHTFEAQPGANEQPQQHLFFQPELPFQQVNPMHSGLMPNSTVPRNENLNELLGLLPQAPLQSGMNTPYLQYQSNQPFQQQPQQSVMHGNSNTPDQNAAFSSQMYQVQQLQHLQQLQQLQHLQQLQQLQQFHKFSDKQQQQLEHDEAQIQPLSLENDSYSSSPAPIDPHMLDLIHQQLQLQMQLDIQRQQQINQVLNKLQSPPPAGSRPPLNSSSSVSSQSGIQPPEGSLRKSKSRSKVNTSKQREYACPDCSWVFNRHSDLTRHAKTHNVPEYRCPFWHRQFETCPHKNNGRFNRLDVLKRHLKLVHFRQYKSFEDTSAEDDEKEDETNFKPRREVNGECLSCGNIFDSMKNFIDHVGDCALTTPMIKWRVRKNGVIMSVSNIDGEGNIDVLSKSDGGNGTSLTPNKNNNEDEEEEEEEEEENDADYEVAACDDEHAISGNLSNGVYEDPDSIDYLSQEARLKRRLEYSSKIAYLDTDEHERIVKEVIPALKRPRGRPKGKASKKNNADANN